MAKKIDNENLKEKKPKKASLRNKEREGDLLSQAPSKVKPWRPKVVDAKADTSKLSEKEQIVFKEAIAKNRIHRIAKEQNHSRKLGIVMSVTIIFLFCFFGGSFVIYNYVTDTNMDVYIPDHEHTYSKEGVHVEGDCQTYGRTDYFCTFPYCKEKYSVQDKEIGDHRYGTIPEIKEDENYIYKKYTCRVCGEVFEVIEEKNKG